MRFWRGDFPTKNSYKIELTSNLIFYNIKFSSNDLDPSINALQYDTRVLTQLDLHDFMKFWLQWVS